MTKPVIILGAGASHDYVHADQDTIGKGGQPPLTNALFSKNYDNIRRQFPQLAELISTVTTDIRQGYSLEESLVSIKESAERLANRERQLIALEFYLQQLFLKISKDYGGQFVNNYRTLIAAIKGKFGGACVITFNYDLLFEQNIHELDSAENLTAYINNPIQFIKLHGSCNWVYLLSRSPSTKVIDGHGGLYKFLMNQPDFLDQFRSANKTPQIIVRQASYEQKFEDGSAEYYSPAIAIPLTVKDEFVCPQEHITTMKNALKQTDRILIIGWKAGDKSLIDIMREYLTQKVTITIVGGPDKHNEAEEISQRLAGLRNVEFKCFQKGGFSNFMESQMREEFFGRYILRAETGQYQTT